MANYATPAVMLVRGRGSRVWDVDGREYVDLIAGIAVNALGHGHPRLVEAVATQLATLGHTSNLYATAGVVDLAERLLRLAGAPAGSAVFFCNSGAEANEAAFKMSRLTGRSEVVVARNSFHGRTLGALALTAQPRKQDPFRPLPGPVIEVEYGDSGALDEAVTSRTAAVFLEPIQGEAGVIVPPEGYLERARQACERHGSLLIVDEVQTGMGRSGAWWGFEHDLGPVGHGRTPDVVTMAKGLGGGLPIGAVIGIREAGGLFTPGSHGTTFGGNPVVVAAAHAVLDVIEAEGLLERARQVGARLQEELVTASGGLVRAVRGRGLLVAAVLDQDDSASLERAAREHLLLVNAVTPNAIRLAPALTITDADVDLLIERWSGACAQVMHEGPGAPAVAGGRS
ncbi:MAG: acetylornithine transaminase [Actinomycetales bacterium]|nr:acetylornithine transaminase [Actinomycetales bacterium]